MSTDLTPTERATVDRFDAAVPAPESLRSRVADAMHQAVCDCGDSEHGVYFWAADMLTAADAAIAVITGGAA